MHRASMRRCRSQPCRCLHHLPILSRVQARPPGGGCLYFNTGCWAPLTVSSPFVQRMHGLYGHSMRWYGFGHAMRWEPCKQLHARAGVHACPHSRPSGRNRVSRLIICHDDPHNYQTEGCGQLNELGAIELPHQTGCILFTRGCGGERVALLGRTVLWVLWGREGGRERGHSHSQGCMARRKARQP